jgi:hypothetical protein
MMRSECLTELAPRAFLARLASEGDYVDDPRSIIGVEEPKITLANLFVNANSVQNQQRIAIEELQAMLLI